MLLKSLEMQGFKSFPDKTVLDFGKGITAVVGPNGSGKSNISDAVRWVLGEQSTKNLRGSKMEDVVFGGTGTRRAQGFAEVTLKLDNSDRSLNCDNDEVSVTRRYYRSGESEYILCGEAVRLRDINELFMDTGLGRDGYSIISQGKVSDIISSKSEERREIFEEAAGISRFRYRRGDAQRRLQQAEENLVRLKDILSELESRVGPLKEQSEKAQKFVVLAQEKKELEIGLWIHMIDKSKEDLRQQEHKISIAEAQHQKAEDELSAIEKEIEDILQKTNEHTVRIDEIRRNASELEEKAVGFDSEAAVFDNSILHNKETIERITKDMEQASDTKRQIDEEIDEKSGEIKKLREFVKSKREELNAAAEKMQNLQQENMGFSDRIGKLSGQISELSLKLADCRVKASAASTSIDEIKNRAETVDETISAQNERLEASKKELEEKKKNLESCGEKVLELSNAVSGYSMRLNSRKTKAEKLKSELDSLNLELQQKNQRAKMLEDLEKNMEGYSGSVKTVMREAKHGVLRGIHGPVSQLIKVENKYSAAIETALGAAMQNIVTDNENDAKRAIYFLKEKSAGRATFLPISAIKGRELQEKGLASCGGYIDIAANLVTYDRQYGNIIESLLGRIAVVENMDSAISIAKKYGYRFRIVTLDGQVINAGGSMTGGSRTQNAGILSRSSKIEKLKAQAEETGRKYSEKSAEFKTAQEELSSCEASLSGAQADLSRAQEEKIRSESDLKLTEEQCKALEKAINDLEDEKQNSDVRIKGFSEQKENAEKEIESINVQINEAEQKLSELTGSREDLTARREELSSKASNINIEILKAEKDVEANEDAIETLRSRKESHIDKAAAIKNEIAEIEQKNADLKQQIEKLNEDAKEYRLKAENSKAEIEELFQKRNEAQQKSTELRLHERAKTAEREKISGELARLEEQKASMLKEYDETINKLFDEYQLTRREAEAVGVKIEEPAKAHRRLSELKSQIRELGSVNVGAIEEYKEVSERYEFMSGQINDIEKSRDELDDMIDDLTKKMAEQFKVQFGRINEKFGETFVELFGGGKAELYLENPQDILESAIEIKVQPPGKNVQNIDLFSGGEKVLAAIALLFAILKVTPAPFCIFDEVEAALDDVNVSRFAQYARRMTNNTQFIIITHRRGTMEEADILYGVTMQEKGVSKLLKLNTSEIAAKIGVK